MDSKSYTAVSQSLQGGGGTTTATAVTTTTTTPLPPSPLLLTQPTEPALLYSALCLRGPSHAPCTDCMDCMDSMHGPPGVGFMVTYRIAECRIVRYGMVWHGEVQSYSTPARGGNTKLRMASPGPSKNGAQAQASSEGGGCGQAAWHRTRRDRHARVGPALKVPGRTEEAGWVLANSPHSLLRFQCSAVLGNECPSNAPRGLPPACAHTPQRPMS